MGDGEGAGCHENVGQGRDYDDEQLNRSILKRYVNAYMYTAFIWKTNKKLITKKINM